MKWRTDDGQIDSSLDFYTGEGGSSSPLARRQKSLRRNAAFVKDRPVDVFALILFDVPDTNQTRRDFKRAKRGIKHRGIRTYWKKGEDQDVSFIHSGQ